MKKIGWLMLYVFLIKALQAKKIWKTSGFFGRIFPQSYRFSMEANQNKFFLNFCFAFFDSLKAVTACF